MQRVVRRLLKWGTPKHGVPARFPVKQPQNGDFHPSLKINTGTTTHIFTFFRGVIGFWDAKG